MTCLICGAKCSCKKAQPGLCCGCHHHKVRRVIRFSLTPELQQRGITNDVFQAELTKHIDAAEQRVLGFPNDVSV